MNAPVITSTTSLTKAELDEWASHAEWIRGHIWVAAGGIVAAGKHLIVVKAGLGHGKFLEWIDRELEMSDRTSRRLMRAAAWAESKSDTVSDLSPSVLYLLASPSTPPEVTDDVIARAEEGHRIKAAEVKRQIEQAKGKRAAVVNTDVGNVEEVPVEELDAVFDEPEIIPPPPKPKKPRKPTKAQLERQELEAERAKEWDEFCDILRILPRDYRKRALDLKSCWMTHDFEYSAELLFVEAELDPDHDWLGEIEDSNLDTEENRQRLEQIKAASRNDANQHAGLGAKVDQVVDDDPLVIPAIFRREKTA